MMTFVLKDRITGPEAWKGAALQAGNQWLRPLSPAMLEALDTALASAKSAGLGILDLTTENFSLKTVQSEIEDFIAELQNGRGFLVLRGLPVTRYTEQDMALLYYGLGLHMGTPVSQNEKGELLAEVINTGDLNDPKTRVYQTNAHLPYHSDLSDVVGLLSLRKAHEGGASSLISVATIYNRIMEDYPEFLALFYRPLYFAHLGEAQPSLSPIFSFHDGKLSCRYMRQYIELGHDLRGLPLSRVERRACDIFDAILDEPDLRLEMILEPGDMQFANNYAVLHSRTGFIDDKNVEHRRKLLRLWLKMEVPRNLAPDFPGRNGIAKRAIN